MQRGGVYNNHRDSILSIYTTAAHSLRVLDLEGDWVSGLGLEVLAARGWGLGGTEEEGEGWSWESGEGVLAVGGLAGRLGGGRSPPRGGGGAWRGRDWKRVHTI